MSKEESTERKIMEAAEEVFHKKGYDGARMQEIAESAGINKGLLHYYFKTKDNLFDAIFSIAKTRMFSQVSTILEMDIPLLDKIDMIIDQQFKMLMRYPSLPRFVLNELNKNPKSFVQRHFHHDKNPFIEFQKSIQAEVKKGTIKQIDAHQLFMNLMGMTIFPFIGAPILIDLFGVDQKGFMKLLEQRKVHIKAFIKSAISL